jgi:hypothetical protein
MRQLRHRSGQHSSARGSTVPSRSSRVVGRRSLAAAASLVVTLILLVAQRPLPAAASESVWSSKSPSQAQASPSGSPRIPSSPRPTVSATPSASPSSKPGSHAPHLMRVKGGKSLGTGATPNFTTNASYMSYNGGPVETGPAVYLIFWGSAWTNSNTSDNYGFSNVQAQTYISNFFRDVPGSSWLSTAAQYCQGVAPLSTSCSGAPSYNMVGNPSNIVKGVYFDGTNRLPSGAVDDGAVQSEVQTVSVNQFHHDTATMYFVFTPHGTTWTPSACAWHSETRILSSDPPMIYALVPYVSDQGGACYAQQVNSSSHGSPNSANGNGSFDAFSIVGGHEYAEMLTDPQVNDHPAWYDSTTTTGEIGDKCDASGTKNYPTPYANINGAGRPYAVQGLWSNVNFACWLALPAPIPATMADPATSLYNGAFHIYGRDTATGHLLHAWCYTCTGYDWSFADLGGIITGKPSVMTYNGQVKVIVDGADGQTVWQDTYNNGWSWQSIACCGANPVGGLYNGAFHVYARDTGTAHLIHAWCVACTGSDWVYEDLGGIITGAPSVTTYNGQVKVVADGSDGATVWQDTYPVGGGWSWQSIACCGDNPVEHLYNSAFHVYAHDTGTGHLIHAWCLTCSGSDWVFEDLGGIITGALSVTTYNGQVKAIVDGSEGTIVWQDTYPVNNAWFWQSIASRANQPVGLQYGNTFQLVAHATDTGHAVHAWCVTCDGSDWNFEDLGKPR